MEIADVAIEIHHSFAVEFEDYAQNAMGRWVLRPHVEHHLWAVQERLPSCGDFYLCIKLSDTL